MNYHDSWNEESKAHFEKIIQAHGGWDAWRVFTSFKIKIDDFSVKIDNYKGILALVKGLYRSFHNPIEIIVSPHYKRVDFKYKTHLDIYTNGKITYSEDQKVIEDGVSIFKDTKFEKWKSEHTTYFFGYAWLNYLSYPFILPEFKLIERNEDEKGTSYKIEFSDEHITHCKVQTFYFNKENRLYRHDYTADLIGPKAEAAHYTEDYIEVGGLLFATTRNVRAKRENEISETNGIFGKISIAKSKSPKSKSPGDKT